MNKFDRQMFEKPKKIVPLSKKALDLLSRRRLSRGELKFKLLQRNYNEAEIDKLLDRYEELGYLDDVSLANDVAGWKIEAKPMGRRSLLNELHKRRIPPDLVESAVDKVYAQTDEEELAERALKNILKRTIERNKVWERMSRLGFKYNVIMSVMHKLEPEGGYTIPEKPKKGDRG